VLQKAAQDVERLFLRGLLVVVISLVTVWLSLAPPALSQEPTAPASTPLKPTPTPRKLDSIKDIVSVTTPRDRRPRDNDIRFDRISIAQGLSQSTVECIVQDSKGFMWFGTEDGLNKYDGYSFTVFRHDPQDPNSLSNNYVRCMLEDHTGTLWIGTWGGGLNRFDPESGQWTHYKHDPADRYSLSHDNILCLYEDGAGVLWIGTGGNSSESMGRTLDWNLPWRAQPARSSEPAVYPLPKRSRRSPQLEQQPRYSHPRR